MGIMLLASYGLNGPAVKNTNEKQSPEKKSCHVEQNAKALKDLHEAPNL
jgi:hypothetical protein